VALALVLLVSAGLLLRSLDRLFSVPPGFDPSGMITMQVEAAGHAYDRDDARYRFFTQALDAVRAIPGVSRAAFTSQLPLSGDRDGYGVTFQDLSPAVQSDTPSALRYMITPAYLETMRIPLRRGRLFTDRDVRGGAPVAIISESLAKLAFPGQDPLGRRMKGAPQFSDTTASWFTVIGIVGDVTQESLAEGQRNQFYIPEGQWPWVDHIQTLVVRTAGDPTALVPSLERAIWSIDRNQPITRVESMSALIAASAADRRFALTLFEAFGLVALTLAAIGIYGVLSGSVSERTREIGVRAALGASRTTILALIGREGMTLTTIGVAIGLAGALTATRAIATLLFGITPLDPVTYVVMVLVMTAVAGAACSLPAWRAARVDPSISLRLE
jgi:putative ABC transport system permease protein